MLTFLLACGIICHEVGAFAVPVTTAEQLGSLQKRQRAGPQRLDHVGPIRQRSSQKTNRVYRGPRGVQLNFIIDTEEFLKDDEGGGAGAGEGEGEEDCSIYNLDACIKQGKSVDEFIDETLNGSTPLEARQVGNISDSVGANPQQWAMDTDSLKRFLSMPIIEVLLAVLVVMSSFLVGLGTLQSLPPTAAMLTKNGELTISAIFTLEYALRWMLSGFSAKFVVQPLAVIDLVAILPGLIKIAAAMGCSVPASLMGGALINLRLLRILRLQRVLVDYDTFSKFELALGLNPSDARPYQLQLARIIISIFTLLSVTSGLIYSAEHVVNPDIPDYFTALYFMLTTLTTVGFGDISPVTTAGRWIVGGSILVGSVVIPAQAAALVEALLDREGEKQDTNADADSVGRERSWNSNGIHAKMDDNIDNISLAFVQSRMDRLEQKVEDTNDRLDKVLAILEARVVASEEKESGTKE